MTRLQMQAT